MPSETFLRLPEEKRERFLEAAWAEFTRVKFADVSINQIVRRAGIPRGSFYQYFADKETLFSYLLEDVKDYVVRVFQDLLRQTDGDLFQLQLILYDGILHREGPCPILDRCFQVLRVNPGIDLQRIMAGVLQMEFPPELMERIHVSALREQEQAYVRRVFLLLLGILGRAIMDMLVQPERAAEIRRELELQIEIIQYGCLRGGQEASIGQTGGVS